MVCERKCRAHRGYTLSATPCHSGLSLKTMVVLPRRSSLNSLHDSGFGVRVHRRRGLVENQNVRVEAQRASQRHALALPAGEGSASFDQVLVDAVSRESTMSLASAVHNAVVRSTALPMSISSANRPENKVSRLCDTRIRRRISSRSTSRSGTSPANTGASTYRPSLSANAASRRSPSTSRAHN